ncbi:MAG: hypothetical protein QXV69_10105 [Sulfolobaceae archaeon]
MIYITDSKGEGRPCVKVYEGRVLKWYYCKNEDELFSSLINLLKSEKNFRIYNVYGKKIYIPNNPKDFIVNEELQNFKGITYNLSSILLLTRISKKIRWKRGIITAELKEKVNAEEILKLGIRIIEPVKLPSFYEG